MDCLGHLCFADTIECCCWLVKDDDRWRLEEELGNSDPLTFSTRQQESLFTNDGIDSLREIIEDKVCRSITKSSFNIFVRHLSIDSVREIVTNARIKYLWLLLEISDIVNN